MSTQVRTTVPRRSELVPLIERVAEEARAFIDGIDDRPVLAPGAARVAAGYRSPLPEAGVGAATAIGELLQGLDAATGTTGPRFFHWVSGGVTPAALAGDWLTGLLDQQAYTWLGSPLGVELELVALGWLKELFGLPSELHGVMTSGATMANFVGLASARQWWGERHGVDVSEAGLGGLPAMPVLASGYIHASSLKALSMLGVGRGAVTRLVADDVGRLDADALERALRDLGGAPAVIVASAGEVNAGDFDPIEVMAELAETHGAWLHVDGAFGLFAAVSPRTAQLVRGVERADSVTVDGHKWLNVPYDTGFAFVRDRDALVRSFAYAADYLPPADDPRPTMGALAPEGSRRARSLAVWSTLRAYGRDGYRTMIEGHLDLAARLARRVDDAPDLHRLADMPLNIVCFRFDPGGMDEARLDELNARLGERVLQDGRVFVGTTRYGGRVAFRPTIVNWRTRPEDVDLLVDVIRELGRGLVGGTGGGARG
jgi:glutamate/tyrosine decarboxylase-like PLP-dependent enzyme